MKAYAALVRITLRGEPEHGDELLDGVLARLRGLAPVAKVEVEEEPALTARQAKALAHPLRVRIIDAMDGREKASPNVLARELGAPLTHVSYHVRKLHSLGVLARAGKQPKRGVVEHFYRLAITHNGRTKQ